MKVLIIITLNHVRKVDLKKLIPDMMMRKQSMIVVMKITKKLKVTHIRSIKNL